jgi:hypothetical protein
VKDAQNLDGFALDAVGHDAGMPGMISSRVPGQQRCGRGLLHRVHPGAGEAAFGGRHGGALGLPQVAPSARATRAPRFTLSISQMNRSSSLYDTIPAGQPASSCRRR